MKLRDLAELTWATLDAARAAVDCATQQKGFVLTERRTRKVGNRPDGAIKAVCLQCSCYGKASPPAENHQRKRVRGSRLTGCQVALKICRMQIKEGEDTMYTWVVEIDHDQHNHEPFADCTVHPKCRALTAAQHQQVLSLCCARLAPTRIVTAMRNDHGITITPRDVYNIRNVERRRILAGRSPLAALLDGLETVATINAPYFPTFNEQRRLTKLFIVSPSAKEICSSFSAGKVWLIDSTYKTNRFGMPLLHVVGVTATSQTFTFAYCFMAAETEENYLWAARLIARVFRQFSIVPSTFVTDRKLALMIALDAVFPDANCLLCQWHISKDILAMQRKSFTSIKAFKELTRQWNSLVIAPTADSFTLQLADMRKTFPVHVMTYLENTWLVFKDRFVAAFMKNKLHFGHLTTSKTGSAHSALKKWIANSTADLLMADSASRLACEGQLAAIKFQTAKERTIADLHYGTAFSAVIGKVSVAGLQSAFKQYRNRHDSGDCHGIFTSNFGHPCKHIFRTRAAAAPAPTVPLVLQDFDSHWWLVQPPRAPAAAPAVRSIDATLARIREEFAGASIYRRRVILNHLDELTASEVQIPALVHGRGRPAGSLEKPSASQSAPHKASQTPTRSIPSQFEVIEASLRPQRRCGRCRQPGHTVRTCEKAPAPVLSLVNPDAAASGLAPQNPT